MRLKEDRTAVMVNVPRPRNVEILYPVVPAQDSYGAGNSCPTRNGERRTAVSGPNTDFGWLETTKDDVERLRHDIAYLEAVVEKYKHNVE